MANRYDIIRIDFQASAKGANTAIESIRQEAEQCNNRITELKKNIAEAPKGTDAKVLQGWNDELKMTEKRFKQFNTAYHELIKGMRALDEGVKMFNDGSLSQMNAAFQKTVNNAAKLAQSKLQTGSNEWRQMGALMQETEQNYARMQRDTDQLIESLQNGGTVFLKTIEDEKKGLQDLLKVLPYMGTEYRKAEEQLQFLVKTTDEMSIKERQLKGEIVTTDDARRVSIQLTEKGAEAARQRAEAADQEIEKGKQEIETLEKEREAREANARASAQAAADYRENQRMHEDEIERLDAEMRKEEALANSKKNGLDALQRKAANMKDAAEAEKKTQQELDGVYDAAKEKVAKLREEVEKLRQGATSTTAKDTVAEAVKEGAEEASAAIKQEAEAKKEEAKAGEEVAETNKKEAESAESLKKKHESLVEETRKLIAERETLTKERDGLVRTLEAEAAAAEKAANAFASLSKEEAEAMLKERQATITKGADGKFSYTNAENAQHFLIESMRQVNPANAKGDALSLDSAGVAKVRAMFKERFGLQSDDDALAAIRGLLSGGENSLIKGGMMNNAFSRIDIDTSKVTAYSKIIKDLTEVINGEVKAIEGESEAKKKLEQVDTRLLELDEKIDANDKASREIFQQRRAMMGSAASATETLTEKTDELSESKRKNVEATNAQIEAIKKMSAEEAKAAKDAMNEVSTVGYKANKLDMSNPEEVQSWLISQMIKRGASVSQDGTLSVGGQNIDGILSSFKERYQLKGDNQKAKSLFKEIVQGKGGGGLLREGGVVDFSADTLMVKANTEAYQGRVAVLKELIKITNKASYEAAHSTETTERDTQAVKDVTEATKELTAIEKQELEVKRLKEAYDKSFAENEEMKKHLNELRRKKSSLPSGMDAALERQSLEEEINDYDENVRKPKGREVAKLKNQWQKAAQQLAQMQAEETTAENQNTEATERNTQAKDRKAKASEGAAKATKEETQQSAELLAKEKELKDAEEEEATAKKNAEEQQKKTTKAVNDATDAETKASDAEKKYTETMKGLNDEKQKHVDGLKELNEANKDTIATNEKNQKLLEETNGKILEQGERIRAAEQIKAQAKTDGIEKTEQAIRLLKEENDRIDQNSFKWKRNTVTIQHLQEALDEMKGKPALMMMEQRMKNVGSLSAAAVTETKKFWETMVAGAEKGSTELKIYEGNLKVIAEEERLRNKELKNKEYRKDAKSLFGDLSRKSTEEINTAINAGKKLLDTYKAGSPAAEKLAKAILDAEEYVKQYGVEAERTARKEETLRQTMVNRISNLKNLSDEGLVETKKYWQEQMKGAERTSAAYKEAEQNIKAITDRQKELTNIQQRQTARQVLRRDLTTMSEGELRTAINAAKEYMQQFSIGGKVREKYNEAILRGEKLLKEYSAETMKAKQQEEELRQVMVARMGSLNKLSDEGLAQTKKYWQEQMAGAERTSEAYKEAERNIKAINDQQKELAHRQLQKDASGVFGVFSNKTEGELRKAIAAAKEYVQTLTAGGKAHEKMNNAILEAEKYLNEYGLEAEKTKQKEQELSQTMTDRMSRLSKLSSDALAETKKYWEAQLVGAERGSQEAREFENRIKAINEEQKRFANEQMRYSARSILTNRENMSEEELRRGIAAAKEYMQQFSIGGEVRERYNKAIMESEELLKRYSVEAERAKQKEQEMNDRMAKLPKLTSAALEETKKFWEAQLAGAERGSAEAKVFENHIKAINEQQQVVRHDQLKKDATGIFGIFSNKTEEELRNAIAAAKEYIQSLNAGGKAHERMSKAIVEAENYLKEYGLEVERTKQKQIESNQVMENQLRRGASLSQSALKAQEQYWQRLIDDPKAAANELAHYYEQLNKVHALQKEQADTQIKVGGLSVLDRLRGDVDYENKISENQRKEDVAALQAYRDALPKEGNLSILREIDYYLKQLGVSAKESAQESMTLTQALDLAKKAGTDGFMATPQEIQQATKAIEQQRDAIIKTIKAKRDSGAATDAEEKELQDLTNKLKALKFEQDNFNMSQAKMQELMRKPTNAVSLDELRAAIKRADGELKRMEGSLGQTNAKYKAFAEQVRNAKNQLKEMEGQAKASATAWEKAWSRLKTYVVMYMGFNAVWQKVAGTIGDMKELSDRMGEVGKTTQMAAGEISRLTENLAKIDTRTALTSLVELSAKAGQLGLKTREDVEGFTEAANKMLVALPEMGAEGATQMMKVALATGEVKKIQQQMDEGLVEGSSATAVAMEKIASTIDQLRANSAAAAPQITDFVKRVGAVGAQSGITIDQVAALGSTVDALGMRVEMSATALSRMIPAIKRNAFEVAKAIGMAPNALRQMFDEAGGGMNAMLAIFQHIKDSGMNANDIEQMLGMGGMADIMKDLNQQGARAGIVFAGLSQNVDTLREHLSIAGKAYEENIAIQQEYDRMNETTAAKWERLGNQIEEMFVGPGSQSVLGDVADALRVIVDLVSGPLNTAFWSTVGAVSAIKLGLTSLPEAGGKVLDYLRESAYKAGEALREAAEKGEQMSKAANGVEQAADAVSEIGDALDEAQEAGEQAGDAVEAASGAITNMGGAARVSIFSVNGLKMAWKGLDTTMKANIIVAVVALLYTLGKALYNAMKATDAERDAVAKANQEADRAVEKLGSYFARLKETKDELDEAAKATDKMTGSTKDATDAEVKMTKAKEDHRAAIVNINKNYSQYLGFMLTEADRAELVAAAHNKIAAAIRREMLMKAKQAAIEDTGKEYEEGLTKNWSAFSEELVEDKRLSANQAAEAKLALRKFLPKSFTVGSDGKTLVASNELKKSLGNLYNENASLNELTAVWFARHLQQNYGLSRDAIKDITGIDYFKSDYGTTKGQYAWTNSRGWSNLRGDYLDEYFEMQQKNAKTGNLYNDDIQAETKNIEEQSSTLVSELKTNVQAQIALLKTGNLTAKETEDAYGELARSLEGINENVVGLTTAEQKATENTIKTILEQNKAVIDNKRLQKAREKVQKSFDAFDTLDNGGGEGSNPWGSKLEASSTDWKNMTAEQLVARRKQMKDFVNAIQSDTDVQAVLGEDAALKKAIKNGMSADMRTVIEWYNTERLKIQDELYARHLTNTGDWKDPKKGAGSWRRQLQTDFDTYLKVLDAYYTERKAKIEQAQREEGMSEAEAQRLTIENETVWRKHRMELQKIYLGKSSEIAEEERQRIYNILGEQDEEDPKFVEKTIARSIEKMKLLAQKGEQGLVEYRKIESKLIKDIATDLYKQQNSVANQMEAIRKIIAQERPFDGLVENLQKNLSTMGVLFADLDKKRNEAIAAGKEPEDDTALRGEDEARKRMLVLMQQAEEGYTVTFERLKEVMIKEGFADWADAIEHDDQMRKAMMAMLRKMYDDVHAAIKKESSQIKKELDIWWNDVEGDGKLSRKGGFEKMLSDLGLQEDQVKRANSLIGAGAASERVADKLAIQQMRVRLAMQNAYYAKMREIGELRVKQLRAEEKAARDRGENDKADLIALDAKHAQQALNLSLSEEQNKVLEQEVAIQNQLEESQNRLYTELREWADLLASSLQGVFEASHAGDAEYYNELAKLNLTGKGGPGAGTYIVIDDEGTEDATAHYEYLDERQALERQHEIERENAQAEAWRKVMDDINMKLSETITDQLNAMLQNASVDANTQAVIKNTEMLSQATAALQGNKDNGNAPGLSDMSGGLSGVGAQGGEETGTGNGTAGLQPITQNEAQEFINGMGDNPMLFWAEQSDAATKKMMDNNKKVEKSTKASFAAMTAAANMYGIAYQTMANDNLDTTQKVEMMIVQAAGQAAISMLTASMAASTGETAANAPSWISKTLKELGPIGGPVAVGVFTALIGGLMGLATSKIAKSKSQIAQVTGASSGAGRLATGMLTYAEGNVNEFSNPDSLTVGRSYNVDGADGKTYRAKYMGKDAKTHITNGPEFHLVGEKGREAIIDAHTTRNIQLNEPEIWGAIKTLYNGGSLRHTGTRRGRGVRAFAEGNVEEFGDVMADGGGVMAGGVDIAAMTEAMNRQAAVQEALLERLNEPIYARNILYGAEGLPAVLQKLQQEAARHGEKYL